MPYFSLHNVLFVSELYLNAYKYTKKSKKNFPKITCKTSASVSLCLKKFLETVFTLCLKLSSLFAKELLHCIFSIHFLCVLYLCLCMFILLVFLCLSVFSFLFILVLVLALTFYSFFFLLSVILFFLISQAILHYLLYWSRWVGVIAMVVAYGLYLHRWCKEYRATAERVQRIHDHLGCGPKVRDAGVP